VFQGTLQAPPAPPPAEGAAPVVVPTEFALKLVKKERLLLMPTEETKLQQEIKCMEK
jgi:hypothetical protein